MGGCMAYLCGCHILLASAPPLTGGGDGEEAAVANGVAETAATLCLAPWAAQGVHPDQVLWLLRL